MQESEYQYATTICDIQQRNIILQDQLWFHQNQYKVNSEYTFNLKKENGSIMQINYYLNKAIDSLQDMLIEQNEEQKHMEI